MSDVQYPNRSDLRNPAGKIARQAAKGQTYGEAGRQMEAQRAVPMGAPPTTAQPARPVPGQVVQLGAESSRPSEPITAGADFGQGPNMMQAGIPVAAPVSNPVLEELKVLYRMFPNEDLAGLISVLQYEGA